jgi:hypothetical protein
MTQLREHLRVTNSPITDSTYVSIVISSMPESYRPTVQTIETTMKVTGKQIAPDDLVAIFLQKAEHRAIEGGNAKSDAAMVVGMSNGRKPAKRKAPGKSRSKCEHCAKLRHTKDGCWAPGGGKEGQGPNQKRFKPKDESANVTVAKADESTDIFAFVCTSDFRAEAAKLNPENGNVEAILDSGANHHFSPHRSEFQNFEVIDCEIKTADGRTFKAIGKGDVRVNLPNGRNVCTHLKWRSLLYRLAVSRRSRKGLTSTQPKHMILGGLVTGIELDAGSKEEFCEPCAKAKAARKPFPKESHTRATRFGERVHWDLWGPAAVRTLGGKSYAACRTDDNSREVEIYFLAKKSETLETYKKDEALSRSDAYIRFYLSYLIT